MKDLTLTAHLQIQKKPVVVSGFLTTKRSGSSYGMPILIVNGAGEYGLADEIRFSDGSWIPVSQFVHAALFEEGTPAWTKDAKMPEIARKFLYP